MVRLDEDDRRRLDSEADHLGMPASTLARVLLHATLTAPSHDAAARNAGRLSALDRLGDLRAKLPPVDAVRLIREGRPDLARRIRTQQ
jgi:hypothetical protein